MAYGRIKRRLQTPAPESTVVVEPLCPLCGRPIPPSQQDAHHWVPKSKGGRNTSVLHRICHRQIHALFSETELAQRYSDPQSLLAHPQMARFAAWVAGKPPGFAERTRKSKLRL